MPAKEKQAAAAAAALPDGLSLFPVSIRQHCGHQGEHQGQAQDHRNHCGNALLQAHGVPALGLLLAHGLCVASLTALYLQELPNGHHRTAGADDEARSQEDQQNPVGHAGEGQGADNAQQVALVNGFDDEAINAPLAEEGDDAPGQAQDHPLHQEGPPDKPVGGAAHLHNGDLLPPGEGGQLDGVGDDGDGDEHQHHHQNDGQSGGHIAQHDKAVGNFQGGLHLGNAINVLHLVHRLLHQLDVHHMNFIPVPKGVGLHVVKQVLPFLVCLKVGQGLLLGDKVDVRHIGYGLNLTFQRLGLGPGEGVVNVRQELVVVLQIAQHMVGVDGDQGEGTHNQQAGHGHAHRRNGHESMGKYTPEALPDMIPNLSISHCRNTLLPRR